MCFETAFSDIANGRGQLGDPGLPPRQAIEDRPPRRVGQRHQGPVQVGRRLGGRHHSTLSVEYDPSRGRSQVPIVTGWHGHIFVIMSVINLVMIACCGGRCRRHCVGNASRDDRGSARARGTGGRPVRRRRPSQSVYDRPAPGTCGPTDEGRYVTTTSAGTSRWRRDRPVATRRTGPRDQRQVGEVDR